MRVNVFLLHWYLSFLCHSPEGRAAQHCTWLGQCVGEPNAGWLQHIPCPVCRKMSPYILLFWHRRFSQIFVSCYSVAPIVRSGEADPDVAKFLNRSVQCFKMNTRKWCLYSTSNRNRIFFPQIERLPVHCGQICSHERRQCGDYLQKTWITRFSHEE